ncbi:MAG: nicotinate-nucleotide adenylyltransferase [Alphaproteobacteria bacterium]|nr:nicotinate-nucleotide adenylyltransferase [Alphaproteobacteria bacterium]
MPPDPLPRWGDRRAGRVGILGGSFNPAHEGHRQLSLMALRRLRLSAVWWLVSPQNPLKPVAGMAPLSERLASARAAIGGHPRLVASAIEAAWGVRYTIDTIRRLRQRFPRLRFVLLLGADNLRQLPRWRRWREIVMRVSIATHPRPSYNYKSLASQAAGRLRRSRRREREAAVLAEMAPPAWLFLVAPQHAASASGIRAARVRSAPAG